MNILIDLSITLPSGAKVEVTKEQKQSIIAFAEKLLLTQSNSASKRSRVVLLWSRRWSKADDNQVFEAFFGKTKKEIKAAKLPLAQRLGRTPASLIARFHILSKQLNQP